MSEMDDKLGAILNNPQLMQQIMNLAQSVNQPADSGQAPPAAPPRQDAPPAVPNDMDMTLLRRFSSLARDSGIDKEQQALLKALSPYLSHDRLDRLERAMHAAKLAQIASGFLNSGGLQFLSGR